MDDIIKAKCIGGPKDGKIVDVVGTCYLFRERIPEKFDPDTFFAKAWARTVALFCGKPVPEWAYRPYITGRYIWHAGTYAPVEGDNIVAIWDGYYDPESEEFHVP